MICSVVEEFVTSTNHKSAFIIGGPAQAGDAHGDHVISACDYLRAKFPNNFYADPRAFFNDVPVLSLGSSYCLMPSRFEPGGIVQHEFFIASTPAVVFATGGLKDSVTEYNYHTKKGNGFEFLNYERHDLMQALHRAFKAFKDKEVYRRLRKNAFESAIDVADVSKEWCSEVYRIRGKVFVNKKTYLPDIEELKIDESLGFIKSTVSEDSEDQDNLVEVDFKHIGKAADQVYIAGTFNNWNDKQYRMSYNHQLKEFHCNIRMHPGKHHYKYRINGKWRLNHKKEIETDNNGNENNVIIVKEK